jgi:hypothetical protein
MSKILGIIVGLAVFGSWMSIVGNPHVVETVMGVIFGLIAGVWVYRKINSVFL